MTCWNPNKLQYMEKQINVSYREGVGFKDMFVAIDPFSMKNTPLHHEVQICPALCNHSTDEFIVCLLTRQVNGHF